MRYATLLFLGGCFFGGPSPSEPAKVTTLFALDLYPLAQDDCMPGQFIGNVAIGSEFAYAVTLPFVPKCTSGFPETAIPSAIHQFSKTAEAQSSVLVDLGTVQANIGRQPRVAALGTEVVWLEPLANNFVAVRSKNGSIGNSGIPAPGQSAVAVSLVLQTDNLYVAAWSGPKGPNNPLDPRYACCNPGALADRYDLYQFNNATPAILTDLPLDPKFFVEQVKDSLVVNATSLFVLQHTSPQTTIVELKKGAPTGSTFTNLFSQPVGLAVNDTYLAYGTGLDFTKARPGVHACQLKLATLNPRSDKELLSTDNLTCMDLAMDATHVYFNIVDFDRGDSDGFIRNRGIGRVNIDTLAFESLELGISGPEAGPREIFIDDDGLILVSPFAVARIAKSELDGRRDIKP